MEINMANDKTEKLTPTIFIMVKIQHIIFCVIIFSILILNKYYIIHFFYCSFTIFNMDVYKYYTQQS